MKRVRYIKPSDQAVIDEVIAASQPGGIIDDDGDKHTSEYHKGNGAYKEEYARIAKYMCQRGATLAELADAFDVSVRAINNWISKYPEFGEAVNIGAHEQFDPRVERSLAELALGYSVDVEEWFVVDKELVSRIVRKHYPPNPTACIFLLKNRMKDKYRDVQVYEVDNKNLKSADQLRLELVKEFKDLFDQGLIALPAPERVRTKGNGHVD